MVEESEKTPQQSTRKRLLARWDDLKTKRSDYDSHWREIGEQIAPRRTRFFNTERTQAGTKKNSKIINSTAVQARRTAQAGLSAGVTSPTRPWFRLGVSDKELQKLGPVKVWLAYVEDTLREVFIGSNIYMQLAMCYGDMVTFGTCALFLEEDEEDVIRAYVFPVGSYALANSSRLVVDTLYRETGMTVQQVMQAFDEEKVSARVKKLHENGKYDEWIDILHVVHPNHDYEESALGPKGMKFSSCWYEMDGNDDVGALREAGYEDFPAMCARWEVTGEDVYGSSPGMDALGDCRALQLYEKRKAQAIDKHINPPMKGPTSMRNTRSSLLPGDMTYVDAQGANSTFSPAIEVDINAITILETTIREHERRIDSAFYANLWLALINGDQTAMTATEVRERHEEKLHQLGPVMQRIEDELLEPLILRVFSILWRSGRLQPPPEELQGMELRIEYISILAQAQKILGTANIERLLSTVGNLAAVNPAILDKVNFDKVVDAYADMLGVPPDLVRTEQEVAALRDAVQKRMAAAQAQEQAGAMVQGAKVLSETDTSGKNALTDLLQNMGSPGGGQASA